MDRSVLNDGQWDRIAPHLPGKAEDCGVTADNRLFVEAVLWMARTGAPWRDLPDKFGRWNSVFKRCRRWVEKGVFERLFEAMAGQPDFEYAMIDGTIMRVHPRLQVWKTEGRARHAGSSALCACRPGHQHGTGAKGGLPLRRSASRAAA